jgi:hypothetical protein
LSRWLRAAPRYVGHTGLGAAQGRQTLSGLNSNERLHRNPKQISLIHVRVGKFKSALVEVVVNRNSGSHFDSPDAVSHQL